jgi:hypothetical protein
MADTLKVNFSAEEAGSEAFDFEPLPTGKYPVTITDGSLEECGPKSKNPGKNYWHLELTVDEGHPNAGRKFWSNVMLFDGALYSLAQLLKAIGREDLIKSGKIPTDVDTVTGKQVVAVVARQRDKYREEENADGVPVFKNEVKGYKATGTTTGNASAGGSGSLLP